MIGVSCSTDQILIRAGRCPDCGGGVQVEVGPIFAHGYQTMVRMEAPAFLPERSRVYCDCGWSGLVERTERPMIQLLEV